MNAFLFLAKIGNLDLEAVSYQITGMLVVFFCLGFLSLVLTVSGAVAVKAEAKKKTLQTIAAQTLQTKTSTPTPATPEPTPAEIAALAADIYSAAAASVTPEIIAVLAAAVRVSVGDDAHILSITPVQSSYAQSGRTAIMNSHTVLRG